MLELSPPVELAPPLEDELLVEELELDELLDPSPEVDELLELVSSEGELVAPGPACVVSALELLELLEELPDRSSGLPGKNGPHAARRERVRVTMMRCTGA